MVERSEEEAVGAIQFDWPRTTTGRQQGPGPAELADMEGGIWKTLQQGAEGGSKTQVASYGTSARYALVGAPGGSGGTLSVYRHQYGREGCHRPLLEVDQ